VRVNKKRAIAFGIGGWKGAIALSDKKGSRNAGIAGWKGAIALSEKKGDRFWDSWMERNDRPLGFDMGKAIAINFYSRIRIL
jgi:hypothetical protein